MPKLSLTLTILAFLALHLGLAAAIPLIEDEAYYALWATAPDWGYYDHPPMIAWMIWAGEALIGDNRIGVRLLPLLSLALTSILVADLARMAGGSGRAAWVAVLWFNAGFLIFTLGFTATPDAPSILFWAAALWAAARALEDRRWWVGVGVLAGLGVLSKLTNLFLGPGLLLWLVATASGRQHLRTIWPWVGILAGIAALVPFLWWNFTHDWLGFQRQLSRVGADRFTPRLMVEYLILLTLLASPLFFWAALRGALRPHGAVAAMMALTTAPLLAYFLWHASGAAVQPNWLAPVFAPTAVLAGLTAANWRTWLIWLGAGIGLGASALLLALAFWPGTPVFSGHTLSNQAKGWRAFSTELETVLDASSATWIATQEYGLTGALVFRLPDRRVRAVHETFRYSFLPPIPQALCDAPALLLRRDRPGLPDPAAQFETVGDPIRLTRRSRGASVTDYLAYPVAGLVACSR